MTHFEPGTVVLLRWGQSGFRLAVVLGHHEGDAIVRKYLAGRGRWTSATTVSVALPASADDIDARVKPRHRPLFDAAVAAVCNGGAPDFGGPVGATLLMADGELRRVFANVSDALDRDPSEAARERYQAVASEVNRRRNEDGPTPTPAREVLNALRFAWPSINCHRGALIDANIAGTISPADAGHLRALQAFADVYVRFIAPRPTAADLPESVKALLD